MIDRQWLDERGWRTDLSAPLTEVDDRRGRLAQLEAVFTAFRPVLRPLVIEVVMCWRRLDTGLPSEAFPWPGRRIFAVDGALPRIAVQPWYAAPPPIETVPAIDGDLIAANLDTDRSPDPDLQQDWLEVRTLAVAVRAFAPIDAIQIERLGREIAPHEPGWFAGPIGARDFETVPPAHLVVLSDGRVSLELAVHWSRWLSAETGEHAALEGALSALRASHWVEE